MLVLGLYVPGPGIAYFVRIRTISIKHVWLKSFTVRSRDSTLDCIFTPLFADCFQGLICPWSWLERIIIMFLNWRKYSLIDFSGCAESICQFVSDNRGRIEIWIKIWWESVRIRRRNIDYILILGLAGLTQFIRAANDHHILTVFLELNKPISYSERRCPPSWVWVLIKLAR
jgi:hypothetical protein